MTNRSGINSGSGSIHTNRTKLSVRISASVVDFRRFPVIFRNPEPESDQTGRCERAPDRTLRRIESSHGQPRADRRRKADPVPRARRSRVRLRVLGGCGDADLRRPRRFRHQTDPRAPRTGRRPHGGRLCAGHGQAGRRARDLGPGRDEHGDRPADLRHGLGAGDRADGADHHVHARQGWFPGGRRHRHHLRRREAQLSAQGSGRDPARDPRGLPYRHDGTARAGADRPSEGRHPGPLRRALRGRDRPPGIHRPDPRRPGQHPARRRSPRLRAPSRALRGSRRCDLGCRQGGDPTRGEAARPDREHAARQGRCRRDAPAPSRHARHARHRVREQGGRPTAT